VYRKMKVVDVLQESDAMDEYNRISYELDGAHDEIKRLNKMIYKLKGLQYKESDVVLPRKIYIKKKNVTEFVYDIEEEEVDDDSRECVEEECVEEEEVEEDDDYEDEYATMASML
jgi:hypothetical protein